MHCQDKKNHNKVLILPIFLVIPLVLIFDVLLYFITRPTCLQCTNVIEFLKTGSLTVFLLGNIGYNLRKK